MNVVTSLKKAKQYRYSLVLMGGHICVDMVQGGLAATLPFLILYNGYSYTQVAMLIFASNIASAIIQPLFGWLGDKKPRPWFMACGVLLAGLGMAGIGLFSVYWLTVAAAMVAGVGIAMLHPEGGRLAYLAVGDVAPQTGGTNSSKTSSSTSAVVSATTSVTTKSTTDTITTEATSANSYSRTQGDKATSMSVFSVGGQIGFCVGPIIAAAALSAWGLAGTLVFLVICTPYALVLLALNTVFVSFGVREDEDTANAENTSEQWGAFALLLGALSGRSIIHYGITGFVPLFMIAVFAQTEQFGSSMIAVFSAMGAVATLLSSFAARKVGTQRLIIGCFVVLIAGLALFAVSPVLGLCVALLPILAIGVNLFNPAAITLGQGFVPQHLGMASGLSFGVAVCIGGIASPILGSIGDAFGLVTVMWVLCGVAVAGLIFALCVTHVTKEPTGK